MTVDHLVLWEEGGPSTEANLLSACRKCNKTRGNTQYSAWLKSPFYGKVSRALDEATRRSNEALLATLDTIPKLVHTRSR
jgi:5-methylcytosine-specific restriction endonuclease McrA